MTWLERLEIAARSGGVALSETECYQLYVYIAHLTKKLSEAENGKQK